jgi:hypothetical protein
MVAARTLARGRGVLLAFIVRASLWAFFAAVNQRDGASELEKVAGSLGVDPQSRSARAKVDRTSASVSPLQLTIVRNSVELAGHERQSIADK